jgi:uncharacterized protein (DUF736 family)
MSAIAKLTKQGDGRLVGTLTTLALHVAKLTFEPIEPSDNDKAPVYRVFAGEYEIGAGWKKVSRDGHTYISVKLDDPSFAQPIWCALFKSEGSLYLLDWNRPQRRSGKAEPKTADF